MKKTLFAALAAPTLAAGCAVVPAEPVAVYAAPPPPAVVVARPYAYYGYYRPYWHHWH